MQKQILESQNAVCWKAEQPIRSIAAGWPGGKYFLAKILLPLIPEHKVYAEPFMGAAWLLFKKRPSPFEIINDMDGELVNLFRVVRERPQEFLDMFRYALHSREEFELLCSLEPASLDALHRAYRFYYIQQCAFGGVLYTRKKPVFGVTLNNGARKFNLNLIPKRVMSAHERLKNVVVERLCWQRFFDVYDRPDTFFYVDPPYFGFEKFYRQSFTLKDHAELARRLAKIRGKFLLSINDVPDAFRMYGGFSIERASARYTCGNAKESRRDRCRFELLVRNY